MTYPYFKIISYGNYKDLEVWKDHFKGLGIAYAVTRCKKYDDHGAKYALWRIGTESVTPENAIVYPPNNEPLDGEIVETWGGFEKYLEAENALS